MSGGHLDFTKMARSGRCTRGLGGSSQRRDPLGGRSGSPSRRKTYIHATVVDIGNITNARHEDAKLGS